MKVSVIIEVSAGLSEAQQGSVRLSRAQQVSAGLGRSQRLKGANFSKKA